MNIKSIDLRSDAAENSIMQTITIAVSAILIAAGLVTAPGLINNARDNNATTDLANIAYAQELYASGYDGAVAGYAPKFGTARAALKTATGASYAATLEDLVDSSGLKLTLSGGIKHAMTVSADGSAYIIAAESKSGKIFYRSSGAAVTSQDIGAIETFGLPTPEIVEPSTPDYSPEFDGTGTNAYLLFGNTGQSSSGREVSIEWQGRLEVDGNGNYRTSISDGRATYTDNGEPFNGHYILNVGATDSLGGDTTGEIRIPITDGYINKIVDGSATRIIGELPAAVAAVAQENIGNGVTDFLFAGSDAAVLWDEN